MENYNLQRKIEIISKLESDQKLKLIWQWSLERQINFKEFIELIKENNKK